MIFRWFSCYISHMAYDGIITYGITEELKERLTFGKIEKVYQPGSEELVLQIHTRKGNVKLYASVASQMIARETIYETM